MSDPKDEDDGVPAPEGLEVRVLAPDLALLWFPDPIAHVPEALDATDVEIALSIYAGESNDVIARKRGEDAKRLARRVSALYRKLGVSSRAELVLRLRGRTG